MSMSLRIILLVSAILVAVYVLRNVKRSKMRIEDTLFWVFLTLFVLAIGIFPQIVTFLSGLLGIASEQNFVFLFFIFILLANSFFTSRANSEQETKLKELTQQIALDRLDHYERTTRAEVYTHENQQEFHQADSE
ncbi:MAG: DUF2304 domain-containing protein [Eggerthellaceae bacterium]|nr:DUF2304 domain-containing protein [Eggerthellaceae bacterium]